MLSHILSSSPSGPSRLHTAASSRASRSLPPNNIRLNRIRNVCTRRFLNTSYDRLSVGSVPIIQRKKSLGAVGTGSSSDREEDNDWDGENITDDTLRATIKETKKVLELQNNLLRQIVEKRKLESSTGKYNKEEAPASHNQIDSYFSDLGIDIDEKHDRKNNSWTSSYSFAQLSTEYEIVVNVDDDESIDGLEGEQSVADALGLSREVNFEQSQPPVVPTQSQPPAFPARSQPFPALLESQLFPILHEEPESYVSSDENLRVPAEAYVLASNELQEPPPEEGFLGAPLAGKNVMNIIVVAAECAPWSKTGGLGDVIGALPKALARRGHRVMVVVPRYKDYPDGSEIGERRRCTVNGQDMEVTYYHAYIDHVDFVFIDSPIFRNIEKNIYGGERVDVLKRMVLLCKVAVEVPWHVPCGGVCYGDGNLVFLANDWHASLLPVYLKAYYRDKGYMEYARCVLVIHNIQFQGRGALEDFSHVDLPYDLKDHLFNYVDPLTGEHFNMLAAGLKIADRVIAVSQGYAWEIKTPEGGRGLHELMVDLQWKLHGIVNGIDTKTWNPQFDVYLQSDGYTNYSPETFQTGKAQCKAALQRELGLAVRQDVPVIAFIGRLDDQKGVDIIGHAMQWFSSQDVQLIMLGCGRPDLEDMLCGFEKQYRDKVRAWVGFSVEMAHQITAGADILLMPSKYEPCGLNQLYGFMYGTVPVVHAVGGLRDTVKQFDPYNETGEVGLGWTFERAEVGLMIDALEHCVNTYRNYKQTWEGLQRRGMAQELGWDNAAQQYEEVLVSAKHQW